MNLIEYLYNCNGDKDKITNILVLLDKCIMELHENGLYVKGDMRLIKVIDNKFLEESFNGLLGELNPDNIENNYYEQDPKSMDIIEICTMGICVYNNVYSFYVNHEFLNYLRQNLNVYLDTEFVPKDIAEYYKNVFQDFDLSYLNDFLIKKENSGKSSGNVIVYQKSTPIGKALENKENAFINVLLLPSILTLIYLFFIASYFLFQLFKSF